MLETFSYDKGSEEYNIIKTEKTQVEKRLKTLCGTISRFTDKGKKMIYCRSKEENLHTYSNLNYIYSEWKFLSTDKRPLRTILMEAEHRDRGPIEMQDAVKKRVEPEEDITHM